MKKKLNGFLFCWFFVCGTLVPGPALLLRPLPFTDSDRIVHNNIESVGSTVKLSEMFDINTIEEKFARG